MATHTELIAVGIAKVRAVIVRVIVRAQTRWAFTGTAVSERRSMRSIDRGAVFSEERQHLAVARGGGPAVVGPADDEQGPWRAGWHPAGPARIVVAELEPQLQRVHQHAIKAE